MEFRNSTLKIRVIPDDLIIPIGDPRLALMVDIALVTALRKAEILGLKCEDVAHDHEITRVARVKVKGGKIADVYFPSFLREKIKEFIVMHRFDHWRGYLFLAKNKKKNFGRQAVKNNRPLPNTTIHWMWHKAQREAGITHPYRFHDLRHTAITRFYKRTKDINLTAKFARHSNIGTTTIYLHPTDSELYEAMEDDKTERRDHEILLSDKQEFLGTRVCPL